MRSARMVLPWLLASVATAAGQAQQSVRYDVRPMEADAAGVVARVRVEIEAPESLAAREAVLVMPRAIPMGYGSQPYDRFVRVISAESATGEKLEVTRQEGPRWRVARPAGAGEGLRRVSYEVDVASMEREIRAGGDSSRARPGYLFLLGYSIFAYIAGLEDAPIELRVHPPANHAEWPLFSTLAPAMPAARGEAKARARDFYHLADSQILAGPSFQLKRVEGDVPLFLALYAEGAAELEETARLGAEAFGAVRNYFGSSPFPHFTLIQELLRPVYDRHTYGFSMEHLESATFCLEAGAGVTADSTLREKSLLKYNMAHHIAHAWIPKRAYGEGYFPFQWEIPMLLDSIWFSEGFAQYAAAEALADALPEAEKGTYLEGLIERRFRGALREMPEFLKRMPLRELSYLASTQYSEDFRIGRTIFARGALMAAEMDAEIRRQSRGRKRLRDALRGLLSWSTREKRAFRIEELPEIFRQVTGADTRAILEKWLQPMP